MQLVMLRDLEVRAPESISIRTLKSCRLCPLTLKSCRLYLVTLSTGLWDLEVRRARVHCARAQGKKRV